MTEAQILVVDDEQDIRNLVSEILVDEGYAVEVAENGETARSAFARMTPDLVLLDIWMPDIDGITLLKEWSESGRLQCPVVMISGHGTLETAVEATRLGAYDFVQKPLSLAKLLATVKQALSSKTAPAAATPAPPNIAEPPVGNSPEMQLLRRNAEQAARSGQPVLISGETGSGKEQLAAFLHASAGKHGAFVLLDALRLAADDAAEYLVGNADKGTKGLFEQARGGTLYLPELQNIGNEGQTLLAAILESGRYTPGGGSDPVNIDCLLVAGISGDAEAALANQELSKSLHLQVSVLPLPVPALRDRPQDVPDLINHYADRWSNSEGLAYRHFSISALNRLRNHPWPGNERELANLVKRLLVLGGEGEVSVTEVDEALRSAAADNGPAVTVRPDTYDLPLREAREAFERDYLTYQLRKAGGSVGKLSEAVGMERTHLYRKLRSLGIDPKKVSSGGAA